MSPKLSTRVPLAASDPGSSAGSRGGRGRGRGHARGRGRGRGRGARTTQQSPDLESPPSSPERNEFLVKVHTICCWVNLPETFADIMVASKPPGLWLRSEGCPHAPISVATSFSGQDSMFLEKG